MRVVKLFIVLLFSFFLLNCSFEENRKVEKLLTKSVNDFHNLFNQEKFNQIYSETDDELKGKFTEEQFVSYLEIVKKDVGEINKEPHIWINDEWKDGVKRIWSERTEFSDSGLISSEKAVYTEKFKWKVINNKAKITSYEVNKFCDKPCTIGISSK